MTRKVGFPTDLLVDVPFHLLTLNERAVTRQPGGALLEDYRRAGERLSSIFPNGERISWWWNEHLETAAVSRALPLFCIASPFRFSSSLLLLPPLLHFSINCFCGCWRWGTWSCFLWLLGIKVQRRLCNFVSLNGISSGCLSQRHGPGPHHVRGDSGSQAFIPLKLLASEKGFYYPFFSAC